MLIHLLGVAVVAFTSAITPVSSAWATYTSPSAFKNIIVFGDSLSDNGNVYRLTNKEWPLPIYYRGRFTNGLIYSEHVARTRGYHILTYAYGGATASSSMVQGYTGAKSNIPVPGFIQQIETLYVPDRVSRKEASESLYIVNIQGNDFFFNPSLDPRTFLRVIASGVDRLVGLGARNILVIQNQDIGLLPYFNSNATLEEFYSQISAKTTSLFETEFRPRMEKRYGRVKNNEHPFRRSDPSDVNKVLIGYLDLTEVFKMLQTPMASRRMGIIDVENGCVSGDYKTMCTNPGQRFYFDDFHPSAKIHHAMAKTIIQML